MLSYPCQAASIGLVNCPPVATTVGLFYSSTGVLSAPEARPAAPFSCPCFLARFARSGWRGMRLVKVRSVQCFR